MKNVNPVERRMRIQRLILSGGMVVLLSSAPAAAEDPTLFLLNGPRLARIRAEVRRMPSEFETVLTETRRRADLGLESGPWSVMDKTVVPPSGDKHDYYSVGPYWWPDPSQPDGLPYIRRDGEVNPDRHKYDNAGLGKTRDAVKDLAFAWYFTGEAAYADRAALLLRTWFLDPETQMNPHLQYGQAIPGRVDGRGIGIIDTARLLDLVDSAGLLESSAAWTAEDHGRLQDWFREYLQWLRTSDHGIDEANTSNNHAVYYDTQVACFALFVGDEATAREVLEQVGPRRIATQIEADGRMPRELARTKSFDYTVMNLRGFLNLARLGEHVGVDLWAYRTDDGRSLESALDWLVPFATGRREWAHPQIAPLDTDKAALLYLRAASHFDKREYHQVADTIDDTLTALLWSDQQ